jgi:hypothetical protein
MTLWVLTLVERFHGDSGNSIQRADHIAQLMNRASEAGPFAEFRCRRWDRRPNGIVAAQVECDKPRPRDGSDLTGVVYVNGRLHECVGIECAQQPGLLRYGEPMALLLKMEL